MTRQFAVAMIAFLGGATGSLAKCDAETLCNETWWTTAKVQDLQSQIADSSAVNLRDEKGFTPLHYAAGNGAPELMQILLQAGADANAQNNTMAQTPLHWAARTGSSEAVLMLIAAGVDLAARDAIDRPVIFFAARNERLAGTSGYAAIDPDNQD